MTETPGGSPTCPPHHWDIGTAERIETWRCLRCGEQRTVDRRVLQNQQVPFTRGTYRKPDSSPPALSDLPEELTA